MAEKLRTACEYPGNFLYSLTWAWSNRKNNRRPFIMRFADAIEDAQDIF